MYRKILSVCLALWVLATSVGVAKISVKCLTKNAATLGCCDSLEGAAESCCSDNSTRADDCCVVQVEVFQADYHQCVFNSPSYQLDAVCTTSNVAFLPTPCYFKSNKNTTRFEDPPWINREPLHLQYASMLI